MALALVGCALGASAQSDPDQRVVVTAARVEQALPDALPSTRVVTRTEIAASGSSDLPGLLRALTSIDVAQAGPLGAQASLFLRGADSRQTLVLVDGVPFARADFGSASWQYLPLEQIERIEIVRGNHSSVYGAQAIGGVVHVITRRADAPSLTLGLGTQGTQHAAAAAGHRFGEGATATVVSGSLSLRRTDGFSARDPAVDPTVNTDRDPSRQAGAGLRVDQGWANGHRTQLSFTASRTRSAYDGYTPDLEDMLTTRVSALALTTRHALARGWTLQAEAGQTRERFDDPTNVYVPRGDNRVRNLVATLGWDATPGQAWQLGLESRRDRYDDPFAGVRERSTDSVRVGGQGRVGDAGRWQAHLRRDHSAAFGSASTGMLALSHAVAAEWTTSVQASSGFSAPSFLDEAYAAPGAALRPERSRQAELALRWARGTSSVRAALFVQRQRDRIDYDFAAGGYVNIARARNKGLELMGEWPLGPGRLGAELTLQDPRNADTDAGLPRRSKQAAVLHWNGEVSGWAPRVALRHVGSRRDSSFTDDVLPRRTTLALGLGREVVPGWRVLLAIDNATDSPRPEAFGYTAPPRSAQLSLQATLR
ncbi:MAG TPA: TonB-dependent receptor [Burkholderiaceae bacterium]|nr:TonB-dependent receptor [Burkholderiaceae bacterium]